jgi:hypothetical protein
MKKFEVFASENNEGIFIVNPLGDRVLEVLWHGSVEEQEDFASNVAELLNKAEHKKHQAGFITVADVINVAEHIEDGGKEITTKMVKNVMEYFPQAQLEDPHSTWNLIVEALLLDEISDARALSQEK